MIHHKEVIAFSIQYNFEQYNYRITADKREIKDFHKLPSATSFIREPLYTI